LRQCSTNNICFTLTQDKINERYGYRFINYHGVDEKSPFDYLKRTDYKYSVIGSSDYLIYNIFKHKIIGYYVANNVNDAKLALSLEAMGLVKNSPYLNNFNKMYSVVFN